MFTFSGCNSENGGDNSGGEYINQNDPDEIYFAKKPVDYSFPEFISETENISELSRMVFASFDKSKNNVQVKSDVVDGFYCNYSYCDGKLFSFISGGRCGLVDSEGTVRLKNEYTSIEQLRPDLFALVKNGKTLFATVDSKYNVSLVEDNSFDWVFKKNQIAISRREGDTAENGDKTQGVKYSLTTADGKNVYLSNYDSIAEFPKEMLNLDCAYSYTCFSDGANYIIAFDEYYNYIVYEGKYATIDVDISGNLGSCYVLSYDHYVQLTSLLSSFNYEETEQNPDEDRDYFLASFGNDNVDGSVIKAYSDGNCEVRYTDFQTGETSVGYYKINKEAFADVIDWMDKELSTEYLSENEKNVS